MGKFNLSKKALKNLAICILYHNNNIDLSNLIKSINNKEIKILIILDGLRKIKNQNKILNSNKNIILKPVKRGGISFCRNFGINYCIKKNLRLLIFLDSDVTAEKNIIKNHIKFHNLYNNVPVIAGGVIPTFFQKKVNIFTKLDGILSWLGHIPENKERIIFEPYHLATINMSLKINVIKKLRLSFNEKLKTGEDIKFCKDVRSKGYNILKIPNTNVHHMDRENFKEVFEHQSKWGKHQFYTAYKFNFLKLGKMFNLIFILLYPLMMPFLALFITLISLYPWVKESIFYIRYIVFVYIVVMIKSFYTYLECFKDLQKN